MHQVGGGWKIIDVYLDGKISQLAQKRSDFAATLTAAGRRAWRRRSTPAPTALNADASRSDRSASRFAAGEAD